MNRAEFDLRKAIPAEIKRTLMTTEGIMDPDRKLLIQVITAMTAGTRRGL